MATMTTASDEALLAMVAHRDVDALTELYDRHRGTAYAVALRITASVPAAEDALQDAFLDAWRQAAAYDPARGSARSWLLAVVHHRSIDLVRRRRSTDTLPDAADPPPAALVAPDVWPEVAGRLDASAVRAALAGLPDAQREAIELAYWGGLTQSQIAARSGVPLGTVKGRMRLGLSALAHALGGAVDRGGPSDAIGAHERPAADELVSKASTTRAPLAEARAMLWRLRVLAARFARTGVAASRGATA
jgi:RNA polymerase sigma-70 factor, ECF subfamily